MQSHNEKPDPLILRGISTEQFRTKRDRGAVEQVNYAGIAIDSDEKNDKIVQYVKRRMEQDSTRRTRRIMRYAKIDRAVSTWQRLTQEDTIRLAKEDNTGRQQAIAMNLPVIDSYIDDSVSFYTEIYAPPSGNFYSGQGTRENVTEVTRLAEMLNRDTKISAYYKNLSSTMRALQKYNVGGFVVRWSNGDSDSVGFDSMPGNRVETIDMYNAFWDASIEDVTQLAKYGEWFSSVRVRNRLWLLRGAASGSLQRIDRVLGSIPNRDVTTNKARWYKFPPVSAGLGQDGEDAGSDTKDRQVDWEAFGLGLRDGTTTDIEGYEINETFIWMNPNQFELGDPGPDRLALYRIVICDNSQVIHIEEIEEAVELPVYLAYLRNDDTLNANRSQGELLRPFQRFISFIANVIVATERGNTYGIRAVDPKMFDVSGMMNGETTGWLQSKSPGRDVRTGIATLNSPVDTSSLVRSLTIVQELIRQFFPTQALPAQIAGMDRAVQSQVAATLQGALKRMQKSVKEIDDGLMNPVRIACYRNYTRFGNETFAGIDEKTVAEMLNSGLGQLNREVSASAIRELLFALIQNPEASAQFDIPGMFTLWSQMLNIGTDLGKMVSQQARAGQQGAQPVPENPNPEAPPIGG